MNKIIFFFVNAVNNATIISSASLLLAKYLGYSFCKMNGSPSAHLIKISVGG
jgi:hypothetical protein